MKDKLGFEIPAHIEALWTEADTTGRAICKEIHRIKMIVERGVKSRDPIFREINQGTVIDLENVWRELLLIIPYAVCPLCEGDERRETCLACRGCGYLPKFRYDRCIPQSVKVPRLERLAS